MLLNNRYQIKQTLGSGGFGETFLAEDTQMPSNRNCVIKQLKPIQNNPQIYQLVQERFQREAAILEKLGGEHNQIPTLYAYFQSNSLFYLVQEYIEGETLTNKVSRQGAISESNVREILVNLLQILDYLHSQRIIHRDIKPDNIILRYRDGLPVLIDFGAVRETMGTAVNSQGNPTSSIVIGTPGYMSSEQAAGRPVFSSDLYSLGLTVIYLLTGKEPQQLETDSRTGEIIWHHYNSNVSPTLKAVIDKVISYHPRERFATAKEMLDALQNGVQNFVSQAPTQTVQLAAKNQPTVAIPASINPPKRINPIVIAGLIAGGLISTFALASTMLTKTPQAVVQEPQSQLDSTKKESPVAQETPIPESPVVNTPETTDIPQASQSTTTNRTATAPSRPNPVQQEEPQPSNNETNSSTNVIPPETQTSQSTATDQTATVPPSVPNPVQQEPKSSNNETNPSAIVPSSKTQASDSTTTNRAATAPSPPANSVQQEPKPSNNDANSNTQVPSPSTEVVNYYNDINGGRYQSAWEKLPPALQSSTRVHPNGYASFEDWWEKVQSIEVQQVDVIENNPNNAVVNARVVYNMKAGNAKAVSLRYILTWDSQAQRWRFRRIQ